MMSKDSHQHSGRHVPHGSSLDQTLRQTSRCIDYLSGRACCTIVLMQSSLSQPSSLEPNSMEDLTDPEKLRTDPKCDRTVSLYGYLRGTYLKNKGQVHIPGRSAQFYFQYNGWLCRSCCRGPTRLIMGVLSCPQVSETFRWQM